MDMFYKIYEQIVSFYTQCCIIPCIYKINKSYQFVIQFLSKYWIFILIFLILYLYRTYWYWRRAKAVDKNIYIAPVHVKNGIAAKLGSREAGLLLRAQLSQIREIFSKERKGHASLYMASALDDRFKGMEQVLNFNNLSDQKNLEKLEKAVILEELTIKIGKVEVPIGAIVNFFITILRVIPILYRKKYLSCLIHITLISTEEETQLIVYRMDSKNKIHRDNLIENKKDKEKQNVQINIKRKNCIGILESTKKVKNFTNLNDLLRDAAFMVLQLHGKVFQGINGKSMRYFTDGILALDNYKRNGNNEYLKDAEEKFSLATVYDTTNVAALYFYGSLLLIKRKPESINNAIKILEKALKVETLKKENKILWALINASLAICYSQKIHRLAERKLKEQEKANIYAENATLALKDSPSKFLKSWVFSVRAQVKHADEGTEEKESRAKAKQRFIKAVIFYYQAIKNEPDNGTLYNNLGWVFLKLSEWGVNYISELLKSPKFFPDNISKLAENYFRQALVFNPNNKLTHANLCLLYANPHFRLNPDRNLNRCHFHGRKAVLIDKNYTNGYRDLTLSLIRYKEFKKAYEYFEKALELSAEVEKDHEIIDNALDALKEMKVPKKLWKKWQSPNPDLLLPPEKKDYTQTNEKENKE